MSDIIKILNRICKNIAAGRFNEDRYRVRKSYFGTDIETCPLFCSYGTIGFTATVYFSGSTFNIQYDREMNELTIDDMFWKDYLNLEYLAGHDIHSINEIPVWESFPRSVELECYTDAGEDMVFALEKPTKEELQKYIDGFDINENVSMWWQNGRKLEGKGVPFNNMKEHYEDYEAYLKWLQEVCDKMPY